jgi:indolepyruvate ferredoxin oxidoreductase beta subunit
LNPYRKGDEMKENKVISVVFAGIGGQGIISASSILATAALNAGLDVKQSEVHGMAQRGGSVVSYVKFGDKVYSPAVEPGMADVVIAFEKSESLRWLHFLKKDGFIVANNMMVKPTSLLYGDKVYPSNEKVEEYLKNYKYLFIDSIEEATKLGNSKVFNTIMLGAISKYIDAISKEDSISAIKKSVPPKTVETNLKAFEFGLEY